MAQQTINVGASANDGTGSPLRTAFQYTNSNFTELYAALGGGSGLPGSTNQVLFNNGTAIAGDAGMTYNPSTDTMTLVNLVLSGTFAARNGDTPSAIRAAASDYAAVNFDGATASTRIVSACQTIGTGDFSIWSRFRVPASAVSGNAGVFFISDTDGNSTRANAFLVYITSGNALQIQRYGATTSDLRLGTIASFRSTYSGQVVDLVITRSGATLKVYINGTDTAYSESTGGTPPAWSDTVVSSFFNVGCLNSSATTIFPGRIYRSVVFNRALSASDVTELITTGVNPADQWGTQTAAYTSDFSVNADNWVENISNPLLTATGNIDGISGVNDTLRFANTDTVSLFFQVKRPTTVVASKRYRVSFDYFAETGSGLQFLGLGFSGNRNDAGGLAVVENAWQTGVSLSGVSTLSQLSLASFSTSTGSGLSSLVASKNVYFKNFVVTRIGAIVDLDFTVGAGYQATDRSTNNLHGTLFNAVEFTQPKRVAVLYATTNTNGNQQMLGTLAIPTNAVIEDIIVNSTGSATVSVGNASAGTQIVNGASVVSGRQKLTLATPFSTTGNLWVNSNSTATLQFTILYTVAA